MVITLTLLLKESFTTEYRPLLPGRKNTMSFESVAREVNNGCECGCHTGLETSMVCKHCQPNQLGTFPDTVTARRVTEVPDVITTGLTSKGTVTLSRRRAEFVYNAARLAAIAAKAPIVPVTWSQRESAFQSQFLEVIERQCGPGRLSSPEELHESWVQAYLAMGWVYGPEYNKEFKTHPDLVPYADLEQREQDKDVVFILLCEIARRYIYEEET